ncbi:MAG: hypothetical protein JJU44_14615, partial [Planctomycetes bacterium]|nr:hypothetical protein [Planctomycetota bacterium]
MSPLGKRPTSDLAPVLRLLRIGFVLLLMLLTMLYVIRVGADPTGQMDIQLAITWWVPLVASALLGLLFLAIDVFTPRKKIQIISGVAFGLVAGLVAAWAIGAVIDLVVATWDLQPSPIIPALKVLFGVSLAYLGITTVLQTQDEFRLVIPYVEFSKRIRGPRPLVLDSSVLIDGRIADVVATGLVAQPVLIPGFVIEELQALADSDDRTKRLRGRRGLDIASKLQRTPGADVSLDNTPVTRRAVDQMLVQLAEDLPAALMTSDAALARVAGIQKVQVVNLTDLANALKPAVLPGQTVTVELLRKGEHAGQAVGFLEDGTMIVAEDGEPHIGETVELTLTSSMQTAAGRLLFARINHAAHDSAHDAAQPPTEPADTDPPAEPPQAAPVQATPPRPPRTPR